MKLSAAGSEYTIPQFSQADKSSLASPGILPEGSG